MCTFFLDLMGWYLYQCFPLPSSRWGCLNSDFILESAMSSQNIDGGLFPQRYRNSSLLCNASLMIEDRRVCSGLMMFTGWTVSRIFLIIASSCRQRYNQDCQIDSFLSFFSPPLLLDLPLTFIFSYNLSRSYTWRAEIALLKLSSHPEHTSKLYPMILAVSPLFMVISPLMWPKE